MFFRLNEAKIANGRRIWRRAVRDFGVGTSIRRNGFTRLDKHQTRPTLIQHEIEDLVDLLTQLRLH